MKQLAHQSQFVQLCLTIFIAFIFFIFQWSGKILVRLGLKRNDIDDRPPTPTIGDLITTPYQKCGRCGHQTWIRVPGNFVCPPYNPNPEVSIS